MEIILLLIIPVIATLSSFLVGKKIAWLENIALIANALELIIAVWIINAVISSGVYQYTAFFSVGTLGGVLLLLTAFLGFITTIYSTGYLRVEVKNGTIGFRRVRESFVLMQLFLLAMYLALVASSPVVTWVAVEATTLTSVFLVSFYNKQTDVEAAWKYLIINSVGLLLAFLGTITFLADAGSILHNPFITWQDLQMVGHQLNPAVVKVAFVMAFIGYGTKMGIAPFHTWRPDAYSRAPVAVVALLSGALLNIACFVILRFKIVTDISLTPQFSQGLFIFFGTLSIIMAALAIYRQRDYKRLLAYSSVEHAGIILLGFGFGGLGIFAAVLHMVYHALTKAFLFLLSGNIFLKYKSTNIEKTTGIINALPVSGPLTLIGFLAISGVPPFGIFITKLYVILAGIRWYPVLVFVILVFLSIIFYGFLRFLSSTLFGELPKDVKKGEMGIFTVIPPVILLITVIVLSLFFQSWMQTIIMDVVNSFKV